MKHTTNGWVIENPNHPNTKSGYIVASTFRQIRSEAIKVFIEGSGQSWRFWKQKYNFRCVRASQTIITS